MAKITTITNPLTGQPVQVDQLDHTAQQIDDGLNIARGVSNPWLNDNGVFLPGCLVDQRQGYVVPPGTPYFKSDYSTQIGTTDKYYTLNVLGYNSGHAYGTINVNGVTVYIGDIYSVRGYTGYCYGPDRWVLSSNITCLITSDGLTLVSGGENALLESYLDIALTGEKVTMSVLADGVLYGGAKTVDQYDFTDMVDFPGGTLRTVYYGGKTYFKICLSEVAGTTVHIKAIKLELGDQQTLAHKDANGNWVLNEIPDYGEQILRCQRYFQTFATESLRPTKALDFRPVMRENPALSTITVGGKTLYTATADL